MRPPPRPDPNWTPASTPEEAIALVRARWDAEPMDFKTVCEDVMERIGMMYEHLPLDETPEYMVFEQKSAVRVFRRCGEKWVSAYAHNPDQLQRVVEWLEEQGSK